MNFLKKNWIIASCILILLACFCLMRSGISSFSYPKNGSVSTLLMLGFVFGSTLIFFIISKRFGDKYTRRLDRIFVYITFPVLILTAFGSFQVIQINNAKNEMQSLIENRIEGKEIEGRNYDSVAYGELAPILQMVNDRSLVQAEKEKEFLSGLEDIFDMISSENLCDKQSREENKNKLNTLLQGIEKYKAWMRSEMVLREEILKKLGYKDQVLPAFRKSSQITLSLDEELMDSYCNLALSINEIIKFVEKHQKNLKLINETIEWDNEELEKDFATVLNAMLDTADTVDAAEENQIAYQQQMLEKAKCI